MTVHRPTGRNVRKTVSAEWQPALDLSPRVINSHDMPWRSLDLTSHAYGGGINVVTKTKLLGGFYGFQVLFPVGANNRIQGTEIDANPGAGLTDSVVAPISLGWHFKRADATAGYTIFVPTGDTPMARPTTRASACGATNSRSVPRST